MKTFYTDAWTSGNPGPGGYRVFNEDKKIITSVDFETVNTNNWYELMGVVAAIKHIKKNNIMDATIFTDSQTVLFWIKNSSVSLSFFKRNPVYARKLTSILIEINSIMTTYNIKIEFISGANNPADYKRRKH